MAVQAELRLGIRDFKANLDRATQEVRKSAGTMKTESAGVGMSLADGIKGALPALSFAALGAGIKAAFNQADDIADLSLKLQESAESIQKVDYAAQLAGSNVDQVADAMIKLERALGDVENKKAAEALANLGFSADELARMSLDEKMIALSDAFEKARASGTGVNDIQALLGRSSAELIPLLEQGGEALRGMFEDAPVVAEETIQQMAEINDQFDAMILKGKSFAVEAVGGFAGMNQALTDFYVNLWKGQGITESFDNALLSVADRDIESAQKKAGRERSREEQANTRNAAKEEADAKKEAADREVKAAAEKARIEEQARRENESAAEAEHRRALERAKELAKAREQAEKGGFAILDEPQQAALLRSQLEASMGLKVGSVNDIERGLATQRKAVEDARAAGDVDAEMAALERLNESQAIAKDFMDTASGLAPEAPAAGVGSLAGLVNQMFGRNPNDNLVEPLRRAADLAKEQRDGINIIIKKMDEQPPNVLFQNF